MNKLFLAAAAFVVFSGSAAYAQDTVTQSVPVRYADLDINHEAGAQTLMYRIKAAAKVACGEAPDVRQLDQRANYDACVAKATRQAVDTVHAPLVASLAGRTSPMPESVASR